MTVWQRIITRKNERWSGYGKARWTVVSRPKFKPGSSQIHIGRDNCWAVILERLTVTEIIKKITPKLNTKLQFRFGKSFSEFCAKLWRREGYVKYCSTHDPRHYSSNPNRPGFPVKVPVLWVSKSSVPASRKIPSGTPNFPGFTRSWKYISDNP